MTGDAGESPDVLRERLIGILAQHYGHLSPRAERHAVADAILALPELAVLAGRTQRAKEIAKEIAGLSCEDGCGCHAICQQNELLEELEGL